MGHTKELFIQHCELEDARAWAEASQLTFPTDADLLDAYYRDVEPEDHLIPLMREINQHPTRTERPAA